MDTRAMHICSILPPHILEGIANSPHAHPQSRNAARTSLEHTHTLRGHREVHVANLRNQRGGGRPDGGHGHGQGGSHDHGQGGSHDHGAGQPGGSGGGQSIVPPHILRGIADSTANAPHVRDAAQRTLQEPSHPQVDTQAMPEAPQVAPDAPEGLTFQGTVDDEDTGDDTEIPDAPEEYDDPDADDLFSPPDEDVAPDPLEDDTDLTLPSVSADAGADSDGLTAMATANTGVGTVGLSSTVGTDGNLNRQCYTTNGTQKLTGAAIRLEGQPGGKDSSVDACYDGLQAVYDLLAKFFSRNSIDNAGCALISTLHYGQNYCNAFWNGSQMVYGDGDGVYMANFPKCLDVLGHELAHGMIGNTAGLIYYGQSGALNESIADCFGVMTKQYRLNQTAAQADWLIGKEIFTPRVNGVAFRSMKAPGTAYNDRRLGGKDPQPWTTKNWVATRSDNGGVHINSGIPNYVFYLVATQLGGYTWERAGQIWYKALTDPQLTPNASFSLFATLTCTNAEALYGKDVAKVVYKAWVTVSLQPNYKI